MATHFASPDRRAEALESIRASEQRNADYRETVLRHAANLRRLVEALSGARR